MKNSFYENQFEIVRQRAEFARHADRLMHISDPGLDPLNLELKGFSDYDTPQGVINTILNYGGLKEVDFQYLVTVNAFEKLKATLRLVEAQTSLAAQIEAEKAQILKDTLIDDQHQIAGRFAKVVSAVEQATHNDENVNITDIDEYDHTMQKALEDMRATAVAKLDNVVFGLVDHDILNMEKEELIEMIGEERLHCVQLVLEANDKHLRKADRNLYEAAYLIKAKDSGIIPHPKLSREERLKADQYIDAEIARRKDLVAQSLAKCEIRIEACRQYMEKIYDMGNGNQNIDQFTPTRYVAAPVRTLFDFTP